MEPSTSTPSSVSSVAIPVAIVIGFGLIAVAIYFSGGPNTQTNKNAEQAAVQNTTPTGDIRPVDSTDHIRGNPNAPIMLVEYSDFDCPFCKQFHDTMKKVMDEYGVSGDVGWVYRHFPLQQLHPNAPVLAQASECVYELGGDDAFWAFSDLIFNEREINEQTSLIRLPEYAETAGVDKVQYEACMTTDRHQDEIMADIQDGIDAGVRGTPHTVVVVGDQQAVINGAQPYATVKNIIESLIGQIEGRPTETEEVAS